MFELLSRTLRALVSTLASRTSREPEILVLRQQLLVLSRKSRARVRLSNLDRLALVWLYRLFPSLLDAIIIVKPETCFDGIVVGFAHIGAGNLGGAAADPGSIANCAR